MKLFFLLACTLFVALCVCLLISPFCFSSISCALKLAFGLLCHHHLSWAVFLVKYHYTLHQEKAALCTKEWVVGFGQFRLLVNLWSSSGEWSSEWVSSRVFSEPVAMLSRVKPWVVRVWLFLASSEPVVEQSKVKGLTLAKVEWVWPIQASSKHVAKQSKVKGLTVAQVEWVWLIQASSKHLAKQSKVKSWVSLQGWLGWFHI